MANSFYWGNDGFPHAKPATGGYIPPGQPDQTPLSYSYNLVPINQESGYYPVQWGNVFSCFTNCFTGGNQANTHSVVTSIVKDVF